MEKIPVIIEGVTCGQGELRREGAYMVFQCRAKWQGGMVRLWLYGQSEPVYVGVLSPDGTLRRRFGAAEIPLLPKGVQCCADRLPQREVPPPAEADVLWYDQGDGTLLCPQGRRQYVAIPAHALRLPRGYEGLRRVIEGREYIIFPC